MHQEGWEPTLSDQELEILALRKEISRLTAHYEAALEARRALHAKVVKGIFEYVKGINSKIFLASKDLSEFISPGCTTQEEGGYRSLTGAWVPLPRQPYTPSPFWSQFKGEKIL